MTEPLVLSNRQCINASCGDLPELRVISDEICGSGRWEIHYELLVERTGDGTFWRGIYQTGATEYQDNSGYDDETVAFQQVIPREKMVTVYERV